MKERYFRFAREAAQHSDYDSEYYQGHNAPAIGAVAVYKGTIIAEAWNANKTSTLQARYNVYRYNNTTTLPKIHAETMLIQRIRWRFGDSIDWSKVHIYLYREHRDGTLALSRPCQSCLAMLRAYGIKKFYYTTDNGYVEEKFH